MAVVPLAEAERDRPPLKLVATEQPLDEPKPAPRPQRPIKTIIFPSEAVMAVLGACMKIVAARVILMLAGAGAFALSGFAVYMGTVPALVSSGLYDVFVFGPCLYLAMRRE